MPLGLSGMETTIEPKFRTCLLGRLGGLLGRLGAILGVLERPLGVSETSWNVLGLSWRFLVAFCGPQGPPKGLHTHICGPGAGPGPLGPVPRYMYICGHDVSPYRS